MNRPRVMSSNSKYYHRPGCMYAQRILPAHMVKMGLVNAQYTDRIPCSFCNSMAFIYKTEKSSLYHKVNGWNMMFKMDKDVLYVFTSIGVWKMSYSMDIDKILLYHGNHSDKPVDKQHPEKVAYHRQRDFKPCDSIYAACKYIFEHDRYREARMNGKKLHSGTVAKKYQKKAHNLERKERRKRVLELFKEIESEDPKIKKLSMN